MTPKICDQIIAIRDSGETNMFEVNTVSQIAFRRKFRELVDYLQEHEYDYVNFILTGEEKVS